MSPVVSRVLAEEDGRYVVLCSETGESDHSFKRL